MKVRFLLYRDKNTGVACFLDISQCSEADRIPPFHATTAKGCTPSAQAPQAFVGTSEAQRQAGSSGEGANFQPLYIYEEGKSWNLYGFWIWGISNLQKAKGLSRNSFATQEGGRSPSAD